jgi:hypothetical protein
MIVATLLVVLSTVAFPDIVKGDLIVELAYDDGEFECATGTWKQAVRFSIPPGWNQAQLLTAKYAVYNPGLKFTVHILGADIETDLTQPFDVTPPLQGWFEVDLSKHNINVSEDFYIVREAINGSDYPLLYCSLDQPIGGRSYWWAMYQGIWIRDTFLDVGIRAIVGKPSPDDVATLDLDPDKLNLASKGRWVTAYVELPPGYDVSNVNMGKTFLDDVIPVAEDSPISVGDYDSDGIPDLMMKFSRNDVIRYIEAMDWGGETGRFRELTLKISGELHSGEMFEGSDTINIILRSPSDSTAFSMSFIDSRQQEVEALEAESDNIPTSSKASDLNGPNRMEMIIQRSSTFRMK